MVQHASCYCCFHLHLSFVITLSLSCCDYCDRSHKCSIQLGLFELGHFECVHLLLTFYSFPPPMQCDVQTYRMAKCAMQQIQRSKNARRKNGSRVFCITCTKVTVLMKMLTEGHARCTILKAAPLALSHNSATLCGNTRVLYAYYDVANTHFNKYQHHDRRRRKIRRNIECQTGQQCMHNALSIAIHSVFEWQIRMP